MDRTSEFLHAILHIEGFDVIECKDGLELVDRLNDLLNPDLVMRDRCDLIIADVRMPNLDGLSVLRAMSEYVGFPPICLVTAFGDKDLHREAKQYGAVAVLNKPFNTREFVELVRDIASHSPERDKQTS